MENLDRGSLLTVHRFGVETYISAYRPILQESSIHNHESVIYTVMDTIFYSSTVAMVHARQGVRNQTVYTIRSTGCRKHFSDTGSSNASVHEVWCHIVWTTGKAAPMLGATLVDR